MIDPPGDGPASSSAAPIPSETTELDIGMRIARCLEGLMALDGGAGAFCADVAKVILELEKRRKDAADPALRALSESWKARERQAMAHHDEFYAKGDDGSRWNAFAFLKEARIWRECAADLDRVCLRGRGGRELSFQDQGRTLKVFVARPDLALPLPPESGA